MSIMEVIEGKMENEQSKTSLAEMVKSQNQSLKEIKESPSIVSNNLKSSPTSSNMKVSNKLSSKWPSQDPLVKSFMKGDMSFTPDKKVIEFIKVLNKYKKDCLKDSKFNEAKEARQKATALKEKEILRIQASMRIA